MKPLETHPGRRCGSWYQTLPAEKLFVSPAFDHEQFLLGARGSDELELVGKVQPVGEEEVPEVAETPVSSCGLGAEPAAVRMGPDAPMASVMSL